MKTRMLTGRKLNSFELLQIIKKNDFGASKSFSWCGIENSTVRNTIHTIRKSCTMTYKNVQKTRFFGIFTSFKTLTTRNSVFGLFIVLSVQATMLSKDLLDKLVLSLRSE